MHKIKETIVLNHSSIHGLHETYKEFLVEFHTKHVSKTKKAICYIVPLAL